MLKMKTQDETKNQSLLVPTSTQKSSGTLQFPCIVVMYGQYLIIPYFSKKERASHRSWDSCVNTLTRSKHTVVHGQRFHSNRALALIAWRNGTNSNAPFLISRDIKYNKKANPVKQYGVFASPLDYWTWREENKIPDTERNDYEVFFNGQKIRFYLDLDFPKDKFPQLFEEIESMPKDLEDFIEKLVKEAESLFLGILENPVSSSPSNDSFQIYSSHDFSTKYSFHILSQKYHTNQTSKVKQWVLDLKKRMRELYPQYVTFVSAIDVAPYHEAQDFRLLGCCKLGTSRIKRNTTTNENSNDFLNSTVVIWNPEDRSSYVDYDIPEKSPQKKVKKTHSNRTIVDSPTDNLVVPISGVERVGLDQVLAYLTGELKLTLVSSGFMWEFTNSPQGYLCPIHNRIHQRENPYMYVKQEEYRFCCRRPDENTGKNVVMVIGKAMREPLVIHYEMKRILPIVLGRKDGSPYPYDLPKDIIEVNERYLDSSWIRENFLSPSTPKAWVIHSDMGSGKTRAIAEIIDKMQEKRIIVITPRMSFAETFGPRIQEEWNERFNGITFEYDLYNRISQKSKWTNSRIFIVQLESLHHLFDKNGDVLGYDLVILDEIVSVMKQFDSKETQRSLLYANATVFEEILQQSSKILMMDGFITPVIGLVLDDMKIPYQLMINSYVKSRGEFTQVSSQEEFVSQMMDDVLVKGKKVYFPSASKEFSREILSGYKKKLTEAFIQVKFFTGDDGDQEKRENAMNVNLNWKADLLSTTAVNTVGLNFTEDHYDLKYMYGSCHSCGAGTMCQMLARVRNTREENLFFYNQVSSHDMVSSAFCTLDAVKNLFHLNQESLKCLKIQHFNDNKQRNQGESGSFERKSAPSWLKTLSYHSELEAQLTKVYYNHIFLLYLDLIGYTTTSPIYFDNFHSVKPSDGGKIPYGSEVKEMTEEERRDLCSVLRGKIISLQATAENKILYQKILFHEKISKKGEYARIFSEYWMTPFKKQMLLRMEIFKTNQNIQEMIERDVTNGNLDINANMEILYHNEVKWLCEFLGISHPHDTKQTISRVTLDRMRTQEMSDKRNVLARIFQVKEMNTGNVEEEEDENRPNFDDSPVVVKFLNRIFQKFYGCSLKQGNRARQGDGRSGRRTETGGFKMKITNTPFYDLLVSDEDKGNTKK
jgi:hypothetical protein